MVKKDPNSIEIFHNLGLEFKEIGDQLVGECPFCGKEKFYLDPEKSTFHCKVCAVAGNNISILGKMHTEVYRKSLTEDKIEILAKYRGLPLSYFSLDETLGFDPYMNRFTWAATKPDGKLTGLRHFRIPDPKGKKNPIMQLGGTKLGMVGTTGLGETGTVYLCAGEWDRIAMLNLLAELEIPGIVLAVPGETNFSPDWIDWFKKRDVVVLYDNDKAGRIGMMMVYKKLRNVASQLRFVFWKEGLKDGYDVHDLVKENVNSLTLAWTTIQGTIKNQPPGYTEEISPQEEKSNSQSDVVPIGVNELHLVFKKWLKLENCDLLDVMMGAMWAVNIPGDPLWLLLVAPPAGSKSETIMPASAWWKCHALSTLSSKALVSGLKVKDNGDPSLLAKLEGKKAILMIKDLTPMLQAQGEERDEVFSILRDAYDGSITKIFGNDVTREYKDLHFGIVAGVTPVIDSFDNTAMGERFLKFRSDKYTDRVDDVDKARRAIMNSGNEEDLRRELREACIACLQRPFLEENVPTPDGDFIDLISQIAAVVAYTRAVAPTRDNSEVQTMEPLVEVPTRIAKQLTKMAKGLALHYEVDSLMNSKVVELIKRVALHTPDSMTVRVLKSLYEGPPVGMTPKEIRNKSSNLSADTIRYILARMKMIGYVKQTDQRHDVVVTFSLMPDFRNLILKSTIFDLPPHDIFYTEPK